MEFMLAPFRRLISYRAVVAKTTLSEIRGVYANSVLGLAWTVVGPVLLLVLYSVVFVSIFRIRPASLSVESYLVYVFAGLIPTMAFSMALSSGAMSLSTNRAVLLNTVFPSELIPLRAVLVASVGLPIGILVVMAAAALRIGANWSFVFVPVAVVLQLMFVMGLAWVLALATLAFRDLQQILQYMTLVLLMVTPIGFTPDMMPEQLRLLMYLNPLYYFVSTYQHILVYGTLPSWTTLAVMSAVGGVSFCAGFAIYQKVKMAFYDYA
jgi:lipopolysaccharide transport system permease protein